MCFAQAPEFSHLQIEFRNCDRLAIRRECICQYGGLRLVNRTIEIQWPAGRPVFHASPPDHRQAGAFFQRRLLRTAWRAGRLPRRAGRLYGRDSPRVALGRNLCRFSDSSSATPDPGGSLGGSHSPAPNSCS
jgi:hypothetical protein